MNERAVAIDYTNWRGERAWRTIVPQAAIYWGSTEWHPEKQWLLRALDVAKGEERDFAMKNIHGWRPV
ncbi:hypothetical protein [Hyphomicrobium sp.]|uniref:hypothetical protein n=1 Tax=Hyphomicrobium sp. TaxID=82 RepID=UPI001E04FD37|nr:hypothetical protein [Hyphomicrobium sp.]MBY0559901.1 hypothetical protein [Hyphomicrobium sp.]